VSRSGGTPIRELRLLPNDHAIRGNDETGSIICPFRCAVRDGGFTVTRDPDTHAKVATDHSEPDVALIYFVMQELHQLQAIEHCRD
jgi:hypothetical protein